MTPHTYRRAKKIDGWAQLAVLVLTILIGGAIAGERWWGLFGSYFTVGGAQLLSWLIWLFATPRGRWNRGRSVYTGALLLLAAIVAIMAFTSGHSNELNALFALLFVTPLLAIGYTILTFRESRRDRAEAPTSKEGSADVPILSP